MAANSANGKIVSFIMSGGVGSRLWPLSREDFPKQFHNLSGQGSMISRTIKRMGARKDNTDPIYLISSEAHAYRLQQEIAGLPLNQGRAIFEPLGRNTAAAVALATQITLAEHGNALILVVPSDHDITTDHDFWQTIEAGTNAAQKGRIVVFGVHPDKPETGYGYIETAQEKDGVFDVVRFVEKPDLETAQTYFQSGRFLWNSGIFLFSAQTMKAAFLRDQLEIWEKTEQSLAQAHNDVSGTWLPYDLYADIPSDSIDYAIMEKADNIALIPARFRWNDLGSWQSLLDAQSGPVQPDQDGNVIIGDVVAIDCQRSYLRSDSGLLSAVGLNDMAVVATNDATFVAPVNQSQNVRQVVATLEKAGRLETKFTPSADRMPQTGAYQNRVSHWLFDEALPLWSQRGIDDKGGFYEALDFDGLPIIRNKRMRTMARQVYAFATAAHMGWDGPAHQIIDHGLDFMEKGRTAKGGWAMVLDPKGSIIDSHDDSYDQSCVLLALAEAHRAGHKRALTLATETFAFLDEYLTDKQGHGYFSDSQSSKAEKTRRSNPHMHLLECFLAWYNVTGNKDFLQRAARIVDLFESHFFDHDTWTVGEYFDADWMPHKEYGHQCEPGHHFEWASLLVDYARQSGQKTIIKKARKLYASAIANGMNRATSLAYSVISREGMPIETRSRSWPQCEVIKAAIALDGNEGPDLKPEVEARVRRLFRWHIEAAPKGLWIDLIDENGRAIADDVPASIFYHLVAALTQYQAFSTTAKN